MAICQNILIEIKISQSHEKTKCKYKLKITVIKVFKAVCEDTFQLYISCHNIKNVMATLKVLLIFWIKSFKDSCFHVA